MGNALLALRKHKNDAQRFRLVAQYYRVKFLRKGLNK